MVIAGVEAATVDAFAAANLPWQIAPGRKVDYLDAAAALGLGTVDPAKDPGNRGVEGAAFAEAATRSSAMHVCPDFLRRRAPSADPRSTWPKEHM